MEALAALMCELGRRAYQRGLVAGSEGNLSCRLDALRVLCTPNGVCKGFLTPDDLCVVDLAGRRLEGRRQPSSEILLHLEIYKADDEAAATNGAVSQRERSDDLPVKGWSPRSPQRPAASAPAPPPARPVSRPAAARAVVHTHAPFATTLAVLGRSPPRGFMPEAEVFLGDVPLIAYETPGTPALAALIRPHVGRASAALLQNHGALTWAGELELAYLRMEMLEAVCRTLHQARQIGSPRPIPAEKLAELRAQRERLGY